MAGRGQLIVAPEGQIFFVIDEGSVFGTRAVIPHGPGVHELAKMAVAPEVRGRGYGDLLMEAAVEFSRRAGASRMVIVSNTRLAPAISLYRKHGFVEVPLESNQRYERADIQMERELGAGGVLGEATLFIPGAAWDLAPGAVRTIPEQGPSLRPG